MFTSQWVWTLRGEGQRVSLASAPSIWTAGHLCVVPPICPGAPAPEEQGRLRPVSSAIWYQFNRWRLLPGQALGAAASS